MPRKKKSDPAEPRAIKSADAYKQQQEAAIQRALHMLREDVPKAIAELVKMATSPYVEDSVKVKAIQLVLDRTLGKPPERAAPDHEAPWLRALEAAVVTLPTEQVKEEGGVA